MNLLLITNLLILSSSNLRVFPQTELLIVIDKDKRPQTLEVWLKNKLIRTFLCSTGREYYVDPPGGGKYLAHTPTGVFTIKKMIKKGYFSKKWRVEMPYAMFIDSGIAIHATLPSHYRELGSPVSGGCIRLRKEHARWLFHKVEEIDAKNTLVYIFDSKK